MLPPKPTLSTLPEELLLAILSHITSFPTLLALARTSRLFHRLTTPYLYHTFPGTNSELFLRTTSHSPRLASYTRKAVWRQQRRTLPCIDVLEKAHIVTRLNELAVPHGTDLSAYFDKYGRSDEYWFFEVVVLFLPAVEELEVEQSWLWDDHHYWFKSLSRFFNPLCGGGLRRAMLEGPMRIENIVPLLTIETLRDLELTQVTIMRREGYRVFQWAMWPVERVLPARSSKLERLVLRESYVLPDTLVSVLKGIEGLREFEYEHVPNDLWDGDFPVDFPFSATLGPCMELHAHSLERIRVREAAALAASWTHSVSGLLGHSVDDSGDKFSVPEYPLLRTLDIGTHTPSALVLLSRHANESARKMVNDLPPGLEKLRMRIDGDKARIAPFLITLARTVVLFRPQLKTIEVVDWDPTLGWYPCNVSMLLNIYSELGLRFVSVAGDVQDIYGAEPLLTDEDTEPGWVLVTDLRLDNHALY